VATLQEYFLQGLAEFNQQRYFECHETLEFLWNQLEDVNERDYVQGILQVGVALYHYQRKNKPGYDNLLDKGLQRLGRLIAVEWDMNDGPTRLPKIDLEHFMKDVNDFDNERLDGWMPMVLLIPNKNTPTEL
jgi:hypothetical protein